jgi:hypothetical protein
MPSQIDFQIYENQLNYKKNILYEKNIIDANYNEDKMGI